MKYSTLSLSEIAAQFGELIKRAGAPDCHVFLWTTQAFLLAAKKILDGCGLDYRFTMVWKKPGGPQPLGYPQYNCEFAICATQGRPRFVDTRRFWTCFEAARGKHSEKPEVFYATLRRVTVGRRLDAYNRRPIDGFECWGSRIVPAVRIHSAPANRHKLSVRFAEMSEKTGSSRDFAR
jgi:N6-adenosine-specific RNA methylase IME4